MNIADLFAESRALCDADSNSYTDAALLRRTNANMEIIVGWLIQADGTAQFDDTNYTDSPIGSYALVDGQSKFSFNDKFLQFTKAAIRDINGKLIYLDPIDFDSFDLPLETAFPNNGLPRYYDKISNDTIKLWPPVSSSQVMLSNIVGGKETGGLQLYFKRTAKLFTTDDIDTGTIEPGFASPYHALIPYMNAVPYCMSYKQNRVALYERKIAELKDGLIRLESSYDKDTRKKLTTKQISFR